MLPERESRRRVGGEDLVVAALVGVAHGRVDADIGDEAADDQRPDAAPPEVRVEVGAVEGAPIIFIDDDVLGLGAEGGRDSLAPGGNWKPEKSR